MADGRRDVPTKNPHTLTLRPKMHQVVRRVCSKATLMLFFLDGELRKNSHLEKT